MFVYDFFGVFISALLDSFALTASLLFCIAKPRLCPTFQKVLPLCVLLHLPKLLEGAGGRLLAGLGSW